MSKWSQVEAIFFDALELQDPEELSAHIELACQGDGEVRREVLRMLRVHRKLGDFLLTPAVHQLQTSEGNSTSDETLDSATQRLRPDLLKLPSEERDLSDAESGNVHEVAIDFLEPSTQEGSLGRLGHYEVLKVLGNGGFGVVFQAFDQVLERVVAMKVLNPHLAQSSPPRKRFLREARSSAKVRHPNIVQVHAVEEYPLPYLVMEYIPGETLQDRLDRIGPLDTTAVAQIGRQIADGLAAAHEQGLIHRDIKPANILLEGDASPTVKISDFGLAQGADDASITQSGIIAGTPMYMAPEQAHGDKLDSRADLFSLGSVLYTMCSGRPPFRANSSLAVLKRVAEDTPRPISEIIPEVPVWLCDIISRLHAKMPEDRFATAREVAQLLAQGLGEQPRPGSSTEIPVTVPPSVEMQRRVVVPPTSESTAGIRTELVSVVSSKPAQRAWMPQRWVVAGAMLLLSVVGLGFTEANGVTDVRGTVIRLFSPEGTLVIEVEDPSISVKVDGSDLVIEGAGAREIRLQPGSYNVEARKDGKIVRRELVTVTKNHREIVRVTLETHGDTRQLSETKLSADAKASAGTKQSDEHAKWEQSLAGMSVNDQVKALGVRMKELNPEFDGTVQPTIEGDVVTELKFLTDHVENIAPMSAFKGLKGLICRGTFPHKGILSNLSPLKGMSLSKLDCSSTKVSDLTPLDSMPLTVLEVNFGPVADLSPLKGMPLEELGCASSQVTDLSPLKGMKLRRLTAMNLRLKDLTPLQGMPLKQLDVAFSPGISDVQPLQGMPLEYLNLTNLAVTDFTILKDMRSLRSLVLDGTQITDVRILSGLQLTALGIQRTLVSDLAPLRGMPLKNLTFASVTQRNADLLRTISTLELINHKSAAEFWRDVGSREAAFQTWLQLTAKLPAAEQVVAVTAKLKERNPAWDGNLTHQIEDGVVTAITVWSHVKDISPVRALAGLKSLKCDQLGGGRVLSDVTPLKDLPLTSVALHFTQVADLSPLQGKPLTYLDLWGSQFVSDLSVVKDMPLTELNCANTAVSDLSPLKDLKTLQKLDCFQTFVRDVSPLKDLKLTYLILSRTGVRDLSPLKDMKLTHLYIQDSLLSDLSPLKDVPLVSLDIHNSQVGDLSPLRNMKLTTLDCSVSNVTDLSPLQGMPLKRLLFCQTGVTDLSPLQGMDLDEVRLTPGKIVPGLTLLREMKNLKTIGIETEAQRPAAEFWERYDKGEFKK